MMRGLLSWLFSLAVVLAFAAQAFGQPPQAVPLNPSSYCRRGAPCSISALTLTCTTCAPALAITGVASGATAITLPTGTSIKWGSGPASLSAYSGNSVLYGTSLELAGTVAVSNYLSNIGATNGGSLAINDPVRLLSTTTALFESSTTATAGNDTGFTFNTLATLGTAGTDKILVMQTNGVETMSVSASGSVNSSGNVNTVGGTFYASGSTSVSLKGSATDGGSAVAAIIDNNNSLANTNAKLMSFRNAGVEKASVSSNGSVYCPMVATSSTYTTLLVIEAVSALETCIAGAEGRIRRVTGTGGTSTAKRTQLCVCTSDGAASPAYAWQNLATGAVGTSTACTP